MQVLFLRMERFRLESPEELGDSFANFSLRWDRIPNSSNKVTSDSRLNIANGTDLYFFSSQQQGSVSPDAVSVFDTINLKWKATVIASQHSPKDGSLNPVPSADGTKLIFLGREVHIFNAASNSWEPSVHSPLKMYHNWNSRVRHEIRRGCTSVPIWGDNESFHLVDITDPAHPCVSKSFDLWGDGYWGSQDPSYFGSFDVGGARLVFGFNSKEYRYDFYLISYCNGGWLRIGLPPTPKSEVGLSGRFLRKGPLIVYVENLRKFGLKCYVLNMLKGDWTEIEVPNGPLAPVAYSFPAFAVEEKMFLCGCDPSQDIWTLSINNVRTRTPSPPPVRSWLELF